MTIMPILPLDLMCDELSDIDERIVRMAFTGRGVKDKSNGCAKLRANKPFKRVETPEQGIANYVWRLLCFDIVGSGKHACVPVCADFELAEAQELYEGRRVRWGNVHYREYNERSQILRLEVEDLISRFERLIPIELQRGTMRWGRALGLIGK